eukprot:EG_transcript_12815
MPVAAPDGPVVALVADANPPATPCVTGTVVVDRHDRNMRVIHEQLRFTAIMKVTDDRRLHFAHHLSDGTWSSVHQVWEDETGNSFALKVIPVEGSNVDSAYANIDLLRRLTHANIVQYHGHFTQYVGGVRCLCMELELCHNGTLVNYLRTHQKLGLSATRVAEFVSQLASALAYIHDQGCLHGDLRPESVLVTADKQLKLTSFGSPLWVERKGLTPRTIAHDGPLEFGTGY